MRCSVKTDHNSSFVRSVDYDVDKEELTLWFGQVDDAGSDIEPWRWTAYTYERVPFFLYGMMLHAQSLGQFYNRLIKGMYTCRRVR